MLPQLNKANWPSAVDYVETEKQAVFVDCVSRAGDTRVGENTVYDR